MNTESENIVYVLGHARSGSTILNIILGNATGIFSAGELNNYPIKEWSVDEYCSCGKRANLCGFWSNVRQMVGSQPSGLDRSLQKKIENWRNVLALPKDSRWQERNDLYCTHAKNLYKAILSESESAWLVDASKSPSRMFCLAEMEEYNFFVVHIVRDPRAVCYSLGRRLKKNPKDGVQKDLESRSYASTIRQLYVNTILALIVRRKVSPRNYLCLRHEDLLDSPGTVMDELEVFLGVDFERVKQKISNDVPLSQDHNVAGNRLRMQKNIKLRMDKSWLSKDNFIKSCLATVFLLPLVLYYRYPVFLKRSHGRGQ